MTLKIQVGSEVVRLGRIPELRLCPEARFSATHIVSLCLHEIPPPLIIIHPLSPALFRRGERASNFEFLLLFPSSI